jgi:hypothetical protein
MADDGGCFGCKSQWQDSHRIYLFEEVPVIFKLLITFINNRIYVCGLLSVLLITSVKNKSVPAKDVHQDRTQKHTSENSLHNFLIAISQLLLKSKVVVQLTW